jgi:hypothetical protein
MDSKYLNSLEHIDPKEGVLVSGLCNKFNEVYIDISYNARKVNRFVPYRVCNYPAPVNEGDKGEFLIGADIETDTPGEWVVCEFMVKGSIWWDESNKIGNAQTAGGKKIGRSNGRKNINKIPLSILQENGRNNGRKTSKPVIRLDTSETYPSIMEASRNTGINPGNICKSCREGRNTGGIYWAYI